MQQYRKAVEKIDHDILLLLKKRHMLSKKIGQFKRKHKMQIKDTAREAVMIANYTRKAIKFGLSAIFVIKLFRKIFAHSRQTQKKA